VTKYTNQGEQEQSGEYVDDPRLKNPYERTPEFESLEEELYQHQPVLSIADGSIAGCQCMDRVFYKPAEDWGTHLAEVFRAVRLPDATADPDTYKPADRGSDDV
jgi:hypothetical protein